MCPHSAEDTNQAKESEKSGGAQWACGGFKGLAEPWLFSISLLN